MLFQQGLAFREPVDEVPPECREVLVIEWLSVFPAEILVKDFILPGRLTVEDCQRNPARVAEIRAYLNSGAAAQDPDIQSADLQKLRADFDLPGLIGETEVRLGEVEQFANSTSDIGYHNLVKDLENSLFELERKLDPKTNIDPIRLREIFDAKVTGNTPKKFRALFQNIRTELDIMEAKEARKLSRGKIARILSVVWHLLPGTKRLR